MNFTSIISGLIGFASGGWGSFASVIVLLGAAIFCWQKYKQGVQDAASGKTQDQAAVDSGSVISGNQSSEAQIKADDNANQAAADAASTHGPVSPPQR